MKSNLLKGWSDTPRIRLTKVMVAVLLLMATFTSCWKDRFDLENISAPDSWNPDVCAPLVHSKLTMKDILNDYDHNNLFVEDETHFLYLVYWNKVYSRTAAEMLAIPNQNVNTSFPFSVGGTLPFGLDVTAPPYTRTYSFVMPNNEILNQVILNDQSGAVVGGNLVIQGNSDLNHNATINVSIPAATKNGVPFSEDIDYIAGSTLNHTFNLSGYQIDFNNVTPNVNAIDITYTVTIHGTGQPNNSPYTFNMNESFQILSFHAMYGDFKQQNFTLPNDSVELRIFDNNIYGLIDFENPYVHMWAYNSMGVPLAMSMSNFQAISDINAPYQVILNGYPNPWYLNAPTISQVGQTATTTFTLDKTNSNVKNAINLSPQWFLVDVAGQTNPAGGASSNFVIDTSRLTVDVQVELPLYGRAWDFRLGDTIDFEFGQDADMSMIEFMMFRVNTDNGFPVDGIMQVYFLDGSNNVLDSLLVPAQQVISAAPVGPGPDYRVTGPVHAMVETTLEQPRLMNLEPTKKIVVLARLATISNGSEIVKIYSDYNLDVRLAARAKFNVNF
jgi:hypothetical protein